jgi:hypothetical protein
MRKKKLRQEAKEAKRLAEEPAADEGKSPELISPSPPSRRTAAERKILPATITTPTANGEAVLPQPPSAESSSTTKQRASSSKNKQPAGQTMQGDEKLDQMKPVVPPKPCKLPEGTPSDQQRAAQANKNERALLLLATQIPGQKITTTPGAQTRERAVDDDSIINLDEADSQPPAGQPLREKPQSETT